MNNLKISTRLIMLIGILSVLLIGIGTVGLFGISKSNDALKTVHDASMLPALKADEVIQRILQNQTQLLRAFQHAPDSPTAVLHDHPMSIHTDAIAAHMAEIPRLIKEIEATTKEPEEKAAFERTKWECQDFCVQG